MPFVRPSPDEFKNRYIWHNTKKSKHLTLQLIKVTYVHLVPYRYRILLTENRFSIASSNSKLEIERLWNFAERYLDSISDESRLVAAFYSLYQNLRELPKIKHFEESACNDIIILENGVQLEEVSFTPKLRKRRRCPSSLVYIEVKQEPKTALRREISKRFSAKYVQTDFENNNNNNNNNYNYLHQHLSPHHEEIVMSEIKEDLFAKLIPYNTLFIIIEDYTADTYLQDEDAERRYSTPIILPDPVLPLGRSFFDSFLLTKKEKEKVIQLLGLRKRCQNDVRGRGIIVRAVRDHPKDHWGKLAFTSGDLFLAFPDCATGDYMWCMGITLDYQIGLFYRYGYAISLSMDKMISQLGSISDIQSSMYYDEISFLSEKSSQQHENSNLSGWLLKKGYWGIWKDWKKRWFVLDIIHGKIFYYKDQLKNDTPQEITGYIDLNEITTVHESFYPGSRRKKGSWPFEIHTYDRVWMLCASRERQMLSWIDKINSIVLQNCVFRATKSLRRLDNDLSKPIAINYFAEYDPLSTYTPGVKTANDQEFGPISSFNKDDFELFGAPDGEEITNKYSIMKDLDNFLGYKQPPAIEYIFVEPYLNFSNGGNVQLSANPYGHAVIRYTLPSTGEQLTMNIIGLANQEMVNFLAPEEYLLSTNFDIKIGNEQGSIYNRNFASIRIQRVPPEKVLAMHQFFVDLKKRSHREKALYNIAIGPVLNLIGKTTYGNCAYYCSEGLRHAGVMNVKGVGAMLPKAIWVDLYEELKDKSQHEDIARNVSIVYYKRIQHAKRFYGLDEDYTGWGRPGEKFTYGAKYENLEQYADAIIYVPDGSKTAYIKSSPKSSLFQLRMQSKLNAKIVDAAHHPHIEYDMGGHIEPRILFNEYFSQKMNTSSLKPCPFDDKIDTAKRISLVSCGDPIWNNCWLVEEKKLFKSIRTVSSVDKSRKIEWIEFPLPPHLLSHLSSSNNNNNNNNNNNVEFIHSSMETKLRSGSSNNLQIDQQQQQSNNQSLEYVCIAAGEAETCWVIYGGLLFFVDSKANNTWRRISNPSNSNLKFVSVRDNESGVWVIDEEGNVYSSLISKYLNSDSRISSPLNASSPASSPSTSPPSPPPSILSSSSSSSFQASDLLRSSNRFIVEAEWQHHHLAPKLKNLSVGGEHEVWGISLENEIFRRISIQSSLYGNSERWIKLPGACICCISVLNRDEVWCIDEDGNVYIWNRDVPTPSSPPSPMTNSNAAQLIPQSLYSSVDISSSKEIDNSLLSISDCMQNINWQLLGNAIPIRKICLTSSGVIGIGDDKSFVYKLSRHRLLVTSTNSARKIWDDRKLNARPYHIGFWRPLPPNGFYCLGYIAERSHLEYPSTETIIVREVGKQEGEIEILASPVGFRKVWCASSGFGHCSVWHPVPPSEDYVSLGEVVMPYLDVKPSVHVIKCVHKDFIQAAKPYAQYGKKNGYLWSSKGASMMKDFSLWLVQPNLTSIHCNTFHSNIGDTPPLHGIFNLKITTE